MKEAYRSAASPASLRVQSVLYRTSLGELARFARAVSAACALALRRGVIASANLAVGDCSPDPLPGAREALEAANSALAANHRRGPFTDVSYTFFEANLGSAGGHNALFDQMTADMTQDMAEKMTEDLVLVINPDTYASPRMVCELVSAMDDPTVGVVEARQLPLEHPKAHDARTGDVSWASGSCFLARSEVICQTRGFDPANFSLYCDDVDFSWRARLAGWRVVHRPSARVFHDKRLTNDGQMTPAADEVRDSSRAAVVLAWRYGRRDLALARLAELEGSEHEVHRQVAAELAARIESGDMPEAIDPGQRVAQFVGADFALHRFSYADPMP